MAGRPKLVKRDGDADQDEAPEYRQDQRSVAGRESETQVQDRFAVMDPQQHRDRMADDPAGGESDHEVA